MTVAEAAQQTGRSSQWVRDQIRSRRLPAQQLPAGSRIRLLVDRQDVERLITEGSPKPYQRDVDEGGDSSCARPPAAVPPSEHGDSFDRRDGFDMDTILFEQLDSDKQKLQAHVTALSGRVTDLEDEVRRLRAEKATLVDAILIIGQISKESR